MTAPRNRPPGKRKTSWYVERKGVDEVFIHVDSGDATSKKSETAFVMRRDGFAN